MDSSLPLAKWGGGDNPEIPRMIDVTGAGSRNDAHRVQLRLVNRAFERYVRYRGGRNEKNESRMVFENLKAAFSEHLTHIGFISRKVGFSRRCPDSLLRPWTLISNGRLAAS